MESIFRMLPDVSTSLTSFQRIPYPPAIGASQNKARPKRKARPKKSERSNRK